MGSIYVDIRATCAKKHVYLCYDVKMLVSIYFTDEGSDKKKVLEHGYYIQNIHHRYDELNLVCPKSSIRK